MKILIVTKDLAEFNTYSQVVKEFPETDDLHIVAEGLSLKKWTEAGHNVHAPTPDPTKVDSGTLMRRDLDPKRVLEEIRPDVVMTGLGSPINLGESFGLQANKMGIALGFVEDLWGVHLRSSARPDFVCTIDKFGKIMVQQNHKSAWAVVTGSPSLDSILTAKEDPAVSDIARDFDRVILVAGQGPSTTEMLTGLAEALSEMGNFLLIPRLHPKWLNVTKNAVESEQDEKKKNDLAKMLEDGNTWRSVLAQVKNGFVLWVNKPQVSIQQLICSADHVVSIYSNVLLEACTLGKVPVSWISDRGRAEMKKDLKLERFPLVDYGAAIEVQTPSEYLQRVPSFDEPDAYQEIVSQGKKSLLVDGQSASRIATVIRQAVEN